MDEAFWGRLNQEERKEFVQLIDKLMCNARI
jgi:hypothetical protein